MLHAARTIVEEVCTEDLKAWSTGKVCSLTRRQYPGMTRRQLLPGAELLSSTMSGVGRCSSSQGGLPGNPEPPGEPFSAVHAPEVDSVFFFVFPRR